MKKLLSIMLVIAMVVAVFAGCGSDPTKEPGKTTDPTEPGTTDTAKPTDTDPGEATPTVDPDQVAKKEDVIEFNVMDTDDWMTRWYETSKEWMEETFKLKVGLSIPRITGSGIGQYTVDTVILPTAEIAEAYTEKLGLLFMSDSTYPDYMPSLYGTTQNCPAAKSLGKEYMVDWTPYLGEGKALQSYVNWLWADDKDYWERAKKALAADDGCIYALPRREMMPVSKFLAYNKSIFTDIGKSWDEQPKTWDEFIALLEASTKAGDGKNAIVPFIITEARLENVLGFIASTYGLEFNPEFNWTEKNGEPLWTYYWDDYLQILTKANELAEKGLTMNDKKQTGNIVHWDLKDDSAGRRAWASKNGWQNQGETGNAVAIYATSAIIAQMATSGWSVGKSDWDIASNWIEQPGRKYSLIGGTQFAESYVAMGKRLNTKRNDNEFTLRICEFLSYSMNDTGYYEYCFGKEGIPFGDSVEKCGNWIWDINPITGERGVRYSSTDRFGFNIEKDNRLLKYLNSTKDTGDTTVIDSYKRPDGLTDKQFWENQSKCYTKLIESGVDGESWDKIKIKGSPNMSDYEDDFRDYLTVDFGTGVYFSGRLYVKGTTMYGDVTAYPMKYTVYWDAQESMAGHAPKIENFKKQNTETNSYIYAGFYNSASVLGTKAGEMEEKIKALKALAKDFTVGFLGHTKTANDWNSYIQNLRDAGYDDVFKFYKSQAGTITTVTIKNDGTMSQSKVEEYRNNK